MARSRKRQSDLIVHAPNAFRKKARKAKTVAQEIEEVDTPSTSEKAKGKGTTEDADNVTNEEDIITNLNSRTKRTRLSKNKVVSYTQLENSADEEAISTKDKTKSDKKKSNSKYEFPRGDLAESFDDEWEQYLVALKSRLLQPTGIDFNALPKNIYPNIRVAMKDIEILPSEEGKKYLSYKKDPQSIIIGSKDNNPITLPQYESTSFHDKLPRRIGYILNFGGSVWSVEWCPSISSAKHQYLAIGGYKSTADENRIIGEIQTKELENSIQIWKLDCRNNDQSEKPILDMVICHEYGCVYDMKWCFYGAYENFDENEFSMDLKRLGLLAVSFGDGKIRIFEVPHPECIRQQLKMKEKASSTLFVKFTRPLCTLSMPETLCWTISWGGHTKIAAGCTNGIVAVWRLDKIFAEWENKGGIVSEETLVPSLHVTAHNSYIRHITWNSIDNPTHIMTCGHDGKLQMFEERDPWIKHLFQKIRSFMITFTWAAHYNVIYFADSENSIRFIQMEDPKKTTGGLILHRGCVWGSTSSYFHPFIASCAADGMVKIANICRLRDRHQRPVQVTVYRLTFDGKEYRYWDNIKAEETTFNNLTYENMLAPKFSPEEAIQRVSWCPNKCAGVWLASGGAGGLVRIDCTEWE